MPEIKCEAKYKFKFKGLVGLEDDELEAEWQRATKYASKCSDSGEQWAVYRYANKIGKKIGKEKILKPKIVNKEKTMDFFNAPTVRVSRVLEPFS